MPPPASLDAYLATLDEDRRRALTKLRRQILAVVPQAEECISYGMPAFRLPQGVVAGFLATRQGCSYYPFSGATLGTMKAALAGWSQTQSALHFDAAQGLPAALVKKLLATRLAELEVRPASRVTKAAPAPRQRASAPGRSAAHKPRSR